MNTEDRPATRDTDSPYPREGDEPGFDDYQRAHLELHVPPQDFGQQIAIHSRPDYRYLFLAVLLVAAVVVGLVWLASRPPEEQRRVDRPTLVGGGTSTPSLLLGASRQGVARLSQWRNDEQASNQARHDYSPAAMRRVQAPAAPRQSGLVSRPASPRKGGLLDVSRSGYIAALESAARSVTGTATWFCGHGSACTRGYSGNDLVGAIDPSLGIRKGTLLTVTHGGHSVLVRVVDLCACSGARLIDLTSGAFSRLAPLSRGVIRVTLTVGTRLPNTDTEGGTP